MNATQNDGIIRDSQRVVSHMKRSIARATSIAFLGGLIGRGLRYSLNIIIARGLGADALGLFAFGLVVLKASSVPARMGLESAVQKFIPEYYNDGKYGSLNGIIIISIIVPFILGSLIAVFINILIPHFESYFGQNLPQIISLFLLGIPLFAVMMVGCAATKGFKTTRYSVLIRDLGQSTVGLVAAIVGSYIIVSLSSVVLGYICSLLFGCSLAIAFLLTRKEVNISTPPKLEIWEIFTFSTPLMFVAVTQYLISWTDILMLGSFSSPTAVGWYQAAFQTSLLLVLVLQSANGIFPSVAADLYSTDKMDDLERVYTTVTKWVGFCTILGLAFIVIFSSTVLSVFKISSRPAATALILLGIGQTITAVTGPVGYLLVMSDNERIDVLNTTAVSGVNFVLNFVLIQKFGIIGAAIATSVSLGGMNILRLLEVRFILGFQPYSSSYWKGMISLLPPIVFMLLSESLVTDITSLVIVGSVSLGLFCSVVYILGFDDDDKYLIESIA